MVCLDLSRHVRALSVAMIETKLSRTATPSSMACYLDARKAFDRYAACNQDPREAGLLEMECIQINLMRWERKSFGVQPPYTSALGVIEELGELDEAYTLDPWLDAIGDTLIFSINLCTKHRLDFGTILHFAESMIDEENPWTLMMLAGQMAHVALKSDQRIRGYADPDVARRDVCIVVYRITQYLSRIACPSGWDLAEIVQMVAAKVMERDWSTDPDCGGIETIEFDDIGTPPDGSVISRGRK